MQTTRSQRWVTARDAAQNTGYNVEYVRQLVRSGAVAAKRAARHMLVDQVALAKHKQAKTLPGQPANSGARKRAAGVPLAEAAVADSNLRYMQDLNERRHRNREVIALLATLTKGQSPAEAREEVIAFEKLKMSVNKHRLSDRKRFATTE